MCTTSLTECVALFSLQATWRIAGSATGAPVSTSAAVVVAGVPAGCAGVAVVGTAAIDAVAPDRAPVDVAFPLRFDRKVACVQGTGIAVHLARQLVVVTSNLHELHCYNLIDGVEVSVVGRGHGKGDMQFKWNCGGMCVTPRGTLLVADGFNNRVPEVDLAVHDRFARVFGQGDGTPKIECPEYVDCNGVHVAVSEMDCGRICVLSYADGSLVGRVGDIGSELLSFPCGIKLTADGSGVVVVDFYNHHVVLLSLYDNVLGSEPLAVLSHAELKYPVGIVQCTAPDGDVAVLVTCHGSARDLTRLMKISFRSGVLESVDKPGNGDGEFESVDDIATLPGGGLVALDFGASCFRVFTSAALRMCWVRLAVSRQGVDATVRLL